ncbi:MAG: NAD(P)/FAD-dependent oxidoreductase [Thermoleophilaceae bacterium]
MPVRKTKRGAERTPLSGDADVLICGASFAGLTVARELAGSGARVTVLDRYEIGERQTSACAAPTEWLERLGLAGSIRQTFADLVIHTPHADARYRLPWTFSTFDYRQLCELLAAQGEFEFETAKVDGRTATTVHTDRGDVSAPLVVDALGWRRVLGHGYQPPDAPLSRGLEVHPGGASDDLEIWIDRRYVPAGYGWSFPARDEVRIGVGSFDPRFHVKDTTVLLADDLGSEAVGYQGNWIPHKLRTATESGVFFAGDSAGHCLPLTAEGIRTAFYFGIACGRELRAVHAGARTREEALQRYHAFSAQHEWKFRWMLRVQRLVPRVPPRVLGPAIRAMGTQRFVDWAFRHYLAVAPPPAASEPPPGRAIANSGNHGGLERSLIT